LCNGAAFLKHIEMKKKFAIQNIRTGECFSSADWEGVYFDDYNIRVFDSYEEAEKRLMDEFELFPSQLSDLYFQIVQVYTTN
jgi:hypothetical protein